MTTTIDHSDNITYALKIYNPNTDTEFEMGGYKTSDELNAVEIELVRHLEFSNCTFKKVKRTFIKTTIDEEL